MAMWNANLNLWNGGNFGHIVPERVLIEYNGYMTFTFRDNSNNLMLAHFSDEDDTKARYIVAPTSEKDIERLTKGTLSLRGAMSHPLIWIIDVINDEIVESWSCRLSDIPVNAAPCLSIELISEYSTLDSIKHDDQPE